MLIFSFSFQTDINVKWDFVPRCFHLTSATGKFLAHEITNPSMNPKEKCPFPFLQDDLYDAYQPGNIIFNFFQCIIRCTIVY